MSMIEESLEQKKTWKRPVIEEKKVHCDGWMATLLVSNGGGVEHNLLLMCRGRLGGGCVGCGWVSVEGRGRTWMIE